MSIARAITIAPQRASHRAMRAIGRSWIYLGSDGRRCRIDLNLARLGVFLLRDLDLEDAVLVAGDDGIRVDAARQAERANEAAVRALDPVIVAVVLLLELAFAAHGEQAVFEALDHQFHDLAPVGVD